MTDVAIPTKTALESPHTELVEFIRRAERDLGPVAEVHMSLETAVILGFAERPRQTDCRHEPAFPLHDTVMVSFGRPDLTCHDPSDRCGIHEPHPIAECGEFNG